jgi:tRNA (guanine26-N2/guanine27-N2)-dimethyltransferase
LSHLQFQQPASGTTEGKAKLIPPKQGVFYNPKMSLGRDFAILFASSFFPEAKPLCVCDPMTGSGVRAVRYVLESHNVGRVFAADKNPEAVEAAQDVVKLNGLNKEVYVVESEASNLLALHDRERFDLIDLDPFGSPAPYFESALRATRDGGILAATATDMGPLTGARPAACFRKYGVRAIRTEFEKEVAVRILAGCLATVAARIELGIEIVFAHASDHYGRIYAAVRKGKPLANQSTKMLAYLKHCPRCLNRDSFDSLESIETVCKACGHSAHVGGPLWLGRLWDMEVVQRMVRHTPTLVSAGLSEIQSILSRIIDEADKPPFHYRTDAFARSLRMKPASITGFLEALRQCGYRASRTHFDPNGFRTDMECEGLVALLRSRAEVT